MADILTALGVGTNDFYTELMGENLNKRILVLNEQIDENVLENYIMYILKWNTEDKYVPEEERTPITIYINSPGGNVTDGFSLIDVIMNSGTKVRGICFGMAASMAYHILLSCDERYAFKNSVLLQHDGEVAVQNSSSKAKDTMEFFNSIENRTKEYVLSRTTMDEAFYDSHYDKEYYMYADEAKSIGVVDYIIGEDVNLEDIL